MALTKGDLELIREIIRPEFNGIRQEIIHFHQELGQMRQEMNKRFDDVDSVLGEVIEEIRITALERKDIT